MNDDLHERPTDDLITELEMLRLDLQQLKSREHALRTELAARALEPLKTRRLAGEKRRVKIEMPDDKWDQGILRSLWFAYPRFQGFLKIEQIGVRMIEYKKLLSSTVEEEDMIEFKSLLVDANRGPGNTVPSVTIEV